MLFCPRVEKQLKYGEVAETVRESSHEKRSKAHCNDSCLNNGEGTNPIEGVRLELYFFAP